MLLANFSTPNRSQFQVRRDPVQEAAVRLGDPPDEHEDRVQGQLQVRGARAAVGRQRRAGRQAAGGGVLAHRQVLPHLLSHPLLHLQHHLLARIHSVKVALCETIDGLLENCFC